MNSATSQKEAFALAGLLSQLGTGNAWNLSKPDMRSLIAGGSIAFTDAKKIASGRATNTEEKRISLPFVEGVEGFSDITTRGSEDLSDVTTRGAEGFSNITTREGKEFNEQYARAREAEIIEPIKKGSISNATLWSSAPPDRDFCRMQKSILEQNQQVKVPQDNHAEIIGGVTYKIFVGQLSGASLAFLRWRRLISPCKAETTNCPVLSPESLSSSTASAISCGTRTSNLFDFAFTDFVAITWFPIAWCPTMIHFFFFNDSVDLSDTIYLLCVRHLIHFQGVETAKPGSVDALAGPLTTTVNYSNEAAMKNHTTPLAGRGSLTPNKFTWRFLAISRSDRNAKPCRMSVEAHTEREARRVLAPHFILSFSSRLPVKG